MSRRLNFTSSTKLLCALLFTLTCSISAHAQSPGSSQSRSAVGATFTVAPSLSLSAKPTSVAVADVNNDGRPDLVLTKKGSSSVSVLLGNGKGSFSAPVDFPAGTAPGNVVLADINGDGKIDVIVSDSATGAINVLAGNGDGTFGAPVSYAAIANPTSVALGNFKGNGKIDLAVLSSTGIALLTNDGSGHFSTPASLSVSAQPLSLLAADINGDGHDDIVTTNQDGTLTVLLGDGLGHFRSLSALPVASNPLSALVVGDFNKDGKLDLAVTQANSSTLSVLVGNGDGNFQAPVAYSVGNNPVSPLVADLNGDSIPDLITINQSSNTFSVLLGNGDGTFKSASEFVAGNLPIGAVAADFDGDGHIDLAVPNYQTSAITLPMGRGDGTFQASRAYKTGLERKSIATGDLDGDGRPDLVVSNYCGSDASCGSPGSVSVFLGNADGTYRSAATYTLGSGPVAVTLADLNGDKKLDLVAINRQDKTLSVLLGNGDGTFQSQQSYSLAANPSALIVGDFNGDGNADVAVTTDCGLNTCTQAGSVRILLGRGDGSVVESTSYPVGYSPSSIAAGDLRGTGHLDLVVANACGSDSTCKSAGTATVLSGDGTGKFTSAGQVSVGSVPSSIALANLAGKGLDLVVAQRGSNQIAVYPANGTGGFGSAVTYAVGTAPSSLVIADFNGDGNKDVAVANFQASTVSVLYGTSSGTLQPAVSYPVSTGPESLAATSTGTGGASSLFSASGNSGTTPMGTSFVALATGTGSTTMTLVSSTNPAATGQSFTLTATVTGSTVPTGTVDFTVGSTSPTAISGCTGVALTAVTNSTTQATATCSTSFATAGSYTLNANYSGDATYAANTTTATESILLATTTTLASSLNPSNVNQSVTLTATVAESGATASTAITGTVSFYDGANVISSCGSPTVTFNNGSGQATASCAIAALVGGSHTLTAVYSGDTNYYTSTSSALTQTVNAIGTTTTLSSSSSNNTSSVNQNVTFTATIASTTKDAITVPITGTVAFSDGNSLISGCGTQAVSLVSSSYQATCSIASLTAGTHNISATFSPGTSDTSYTSSTSTTLAQTVNQVSITIGITTPSTSPTVDQTVTFTATLPSSGTVSTPITGTVQFTDNAVTTSIGCDSVSVVYSSTNGNATAQCSTTLLIAANNHKVTANYSGDTSYKSASATSGNFQVSAVNTTTTVSASSSPTAGQPITLTANVTPQVTPVPSTIVPFDTTKVVTFNDGSNAITCSAVATISSTGTATCTTSSLTSGSHSITASFPGDSNYNKSTSSTFTLTVNAASATTSLAASPSTSTVVNNQVTFTETVSAPSSGSPTPSGTVSFTDNGKAISSSCTSVSLTNGAAKCVTSTLTAGNHPISANYSGDTNYSSATNSLTQAVSQATSSTAVASSSTNNTSSVNQSVTFTATVTPYNSPVALSGSVTFTDNGNPIGCSVNWNASTGTATCTTSTLTQGTHTIAANYASDPNYTNSSNSLTQTVGQATTTVGLTAQPNPSTVNQTVQFTAKITATSGSVSPTGTVSFMEGTTALPNCASVAVTTTGSATCSDASLSLGSHTITAKYSGDTNFGGSSGTVTQQVNQSPTSVSVSSPTPSSTVNQSVTFNATVSTSVSGGSTTFAGTMTITDSTTSTVICTQAITGTATSATASCSTSSLAAGTHTITAAYSADTNFANSSGTTSQSVGKAASSLVFTISPNPVIVNDPVTLTATVSPTTGAIPLSGSVTFMDGSNGVAGCTAAVPVNPSTGVATCVTSSLSTGTHNIAATYGSDSNYTSSTGTLTETVEDFSVASSASSATITQGFTSLTDPFSPNPSLTVTSGSSAGFNGNLTITCAQDTQTAPVALSGATPPVCGLTTSTGATPTSSVTISVTSSGTPQIVTIVIDATNASPGIYTYDITATDNTSGLKHSTTITAIVRGVSTPLTIASGATTGNTATGTFLLPPGVSLTSFECLRISGTGLPALGVTPSAISVACSFNPSSIASATAIQAGQLTVTITTGGATTTAAITRHSDFLAAGLAGLPIFGLLGLLRSRRSRNSVFFRMMAVLAFIAAAYQVMGCGGSFQKPTASGGQTPPGVYNILVQGTGSDNSIYQTVIKVNVTL